MPVVDVINVNSEKVGEVELPDAIFSVPLRPHLVHEVVVAQLHSRRAGTASTKTRGELAYSNRKPYSQKKTGRARAGSRRSPLWRGGGTIFGPKPRDFSWRPPIRIRREALRVVLTAKLVEEKLTIVDAIPTDGIRTKALYQTLDKMGLLEALLVTPDRNHDLELSGRNLPDFKILRVDGLNCYDILRHDRLVITRDSLGPIEERLLK
ncbi:MAG: 50S ribosomal protein L4 [Deltaproteobacteria bacterium]|jgi:large subunit ribosomal protein L4|nr:50S ribosomal protein L4 [Deltaproteobacteria bacterium]